MRCDFFNWIQLTHDRFQWRALVSKSLEPFGSIQLLKFVWLISFSEGLWTVEFVTVNDSEHFSVKYNMVWHVDPLPGNDNKIRKYTTTVTRQRPVNSNRRTMFSTRSMPRCYKRGLSDVVVSELENCCVWIVVSCCCEKLIAEAWR
jgi:hypothetical protein